MTESPVYTATPRLERPRDSAFRGVCTAVARATGTDPLLWRVLIVVLTLFNGLGVLLYLIGIATIPREDQEHSLAERLLRGPDRHLEGRQLLLVVLLVVSAVAYLGHESSLVVVAVAGILALVWWRGREDVPPTTPVVTTAAPVAEPPVWTPPPPRPPRPRSPFGGITLALAAAVAGLLALLDATGTDMPVAVPIAGALAVVGVGLVVGSFFGRSWGLVLLAAALTASLGVAAAVQPLVDDGVGTRDWSPTASADYRLGAGKGVLDLGSVRPSADITAHVGYGQLLVEVPAGLAVDLDARSEYGDVQVYGKEVGGRHEHQVLSDPDATVHLHLSVRAGQVKVVHQ
jgi:phage shock protein PspC (stress-responsive transcriptional regulator)